MNIHNLNTVIHLQDALEQAKKQLHAINTFPHMVSVRYGGGDLGVAVRNKVLTLLLEFYQEKIDSATAQLIELGVDLSPLPPEEEDEE